MKIKNNPMPIDSQLDPDIEYVLKFFRDHTWLTSNNFWKRAFAIIGHQYAAILAIYLAALFVIIAMVIAATIFTAIVS